jgi:hypothetical protein
LVLRYGLPGYGKTVEFVNWLTDFFKKGSLISSNGEIGGIFGTSQSGIWLTDFFKKGSLISSNGF